MSLIQPYCTTCNASGRESSPCIDGICDACHEAKRQALDAGALSAVGWLLSRRLDSATLASIHEPRPACGIGASLWDMFANTHRPT